MCMCRTLWRVVGSSWEPKTQGGRSGVLEKRLKGSTGKADEG